MGQGATFDLSPHHLLSCLARSCGNRAFPFFLHISARVRHPLPEDMSPKQQAKVSGKLRWLWPGAVESRRTFIPSPSSASQRVRGRVRARDSNWSDAACIGSLLLVFIRTRTENERRRNWPTEVPMPASERQTRRACVASYRGFRALDCSAIAFSKAC